MLTALATARSRNMTMMMTCVMRKKKRHGKTRERKLNTTFIERTPKRKHQKQQLQLVTSQKVPMAEKKKRKNNNVSNKNEKNEESCSY
eukprot:15197302-Ditylum_brightwellii.AAC.1